jgi:hypothetical protein
MKKIFPLLFLLAACTGRSYKPADHLTAREQDELLWTIIRYIGRAPEGITTQEKFYKGYDPHYQEMKSRHRIDAYFKQSNTQFFLISRLAPSLTEKRVATGGKMEVNAAGELVYYEEVFRTWKMPDSVLQKKGLMLFDKMVRGESLEPYYTKNSFPEEYIEFPDDHNYYDVATREWKLR